MSKRERVELELNESEGQIYGFFDIDDTLTRGNTTIFFTKFLAQIGFVSPETWENVQFDLKRYGSSDRGDKAYFVFARDVLSHLASGLKGKSVVLVREKAREFFDAALKGEVEGYQICDFSESLVSKIKEIGRAVAISGSPEEVLVPINDYLGFDEIQATIFEKKDGILMRMERGY